MYDIVRPLKPLRAPKGVDNWALCAVCPFCNAGVDERCRSKRTGLPTTIHSGRFVKAQAIQRERERAADPHASESMQEALQAAFDGSLPCTECSCIEPCERLARHGIVATDFDL